MVTTADILRYVGYDYLPQRYQDKFRGWAAAIDAGTLPKNQIEQLAAEFVSTSNTYGVVFEAASAPKSLVPVFIRKVTTGPAAPVPTGWIATTGGWVKPDRNPSNPQQIWTAPVPAAPVSAIVTAPIQESRESADWIAPPIYQPPPPPQDTTGTTLAAGSASAESSSLSAPAQVTAPALKLQTESAMATTQIDATPTTPAPGPGYVWDATAGKWSWLGAVGGALTGLVSGGPAGALIGAGLGGLQGGAQAPTAPGGMPGYVPPVTIPTYPSTPPGGYGMGGAPIGVGFTGATPGFAGGSAIPTTQGGPDLLDWAQILGGAVPGVPGAVLQWGLSQMDQPPALPQGVTTANGQVIVEPMARTIQKAPPGYVLVTRDWLGNGTQVTYAVRKDMARCYGYKKPAKPPISVGDWNALKKANRTVKKVQRVEKMTAALTKCSTTRRRR